MRIKGQDYLYAIYLSIISEYSASADICGAGWIALESKCFFISTEEEPVDIAKEKCEEKGANLASITSEAENNQLKGSND